MWGRDGGGARHGCELMGKLGMYVQAIKRGEQLLDCLVGSATDPALPAGGTAFEVGNG